MAQKGHKQEGMSCGEVFAVCGFAPIAPFVLELQLAKKKKKKKKKTKTVIFEARLFLSGICSLAFMVSL